MSPNARIAASALALAGIIGLVPVNPVKAEPSRTVNDPTGDVVLEDGTPTSEPGADVTEATARIGQDGIVLRATTTDPAHPKSSPNWNGGFSVLGWRIDVDNDGQDEFQVEYTSDPTKIYGDVYTPGTEAGGKPVCQAKAARFRDGYYEMVIDPACIGNPARFWFKALLVWDTDPKDPQAPAAADNAPNGAKWDGPVELPVDPGPAPDPGTGTDPDPGTDPGTDPGPDTDPDPGTDPAPAGPQGYWLVGRDGGIFSFGSAGFYGSTGNIALNRPIVGMTADPDGKGYWFVASDGGIFAYEAAFYGSTGSLRLARPIVGMASTPTGRGYWLVASDGGIFAFGDAGFYGSTGAINLAKPIVGMASTPTGRGYWLVASDGGIFAFGDAGFYGSTGAINLNRPIVGMAPTPNGRGYWFVADDGGVFAFGAARFFGSAGSFVGASPVVGIGTTRDGDGYRLVRADGSVAHFGRADNQGSMSGQALSSPIVGMAIYQ